MKNNNIQKKLFLSVYTFLIIILFIVSLISYFFIFQYLKNREIKSLISKSSSTKKNIEMILKMVENFDDIIYKNDFLIDILNKSEENTTTLDKEKVDFFLSNLSNANSFIKGVHLIGENNIFFSNLPKLEKENLGSILHNYDLQNNIQKITVNYYEPYSNYEIISYHIPVYNFKTKTLLGKLIIDINIDYFSELFLSSVMEVDEKVFIVDSNNEIIFNYPANIDFNYILKDDSLSQIDYIDKNTLLSSEIIKYSNWKYIRIIPIDKTIIKFTRVLRFMIYLIFLILLISTYFTFKFSVFFTDPIILLNKKFKEMEKGNLNLQLNFNRKDEIGELGNSFNKMVKELDKLIKAQINSQKRRDELRFQILQAQINPHFLYNTLDSIRWMAIIQDIPNIRDMASAIINLLRYNISTEEDVVSIENEIDSIKNYLIIQKFRYGNKFEATYKLDETLLNNRIIRFALQPLIENSFYHAFELDRKRGIFEIRLFKQNNEVILEIEDNGKGLNQNMSKKDSLKMHTGIGIKNIDERIKLHFGDEYGVKIFPAQTCGTIVQINLPKNNIF